MRCGECVDMRASALPSSACPSSSESKISDTKDETKLSHSLSLLALLKRFVDSASPSGKDASRALHFSPF